MSESVDVLAEVLRLLASQRTISLATVSRQGMPHACNVQVAFDASPGLYFLSSPAAAHTEHLLRTQRAMVTMYHHADDHPQTLCGFQMRTEATAPLRDSAEWSAAWATYVARFPFVETDEHFRALALAQQMFILRPTWARWIDNRVRFGFRAEWLAVTTPPTAPL